MLETSVISYRNLTPEQKEVLFRNIPDRIKDIPGWSVTRLTGARQKAPIHPLTDKLVDPTDKTQGTTFHDCWCSVVDNIYDALGFTFQTEYGLAVMDMDNKEQNAEVQTRIETISSAYIAAGHYTEDSQSFLGKHIVVEGTLPEGKGRRRDNIEIYCNARFMIFTGRGSGLIMPDRVGTIMEAYNQMDDDRASNIEFDDSVTDIRTVDQIRNLVRGMANGVRVRYMIEVGYNPGDRSAQDAELAEAIFFHTLDHRLARRVFESAACWDAERIAEKNRKRGGKAEEYLEMTLKFAYSQVLARRDVQRRAAEEAKINVQRAMEAQAKVEEGTKLPGTPVPTDFPSDAQALTAMYNHARFNAYKDFKEGAAISALIHAGAIVSRGYVTPTGLGTNLYGAIVAYSGWGKEGCIAELRSLISQVADESNGTLGFLNGMLGSDYGSQEAFREALADNRVMCLWHQEFGKKMKAALRPNSNAFQTGLFDLMTKLFTLSGENKKLHEHKVRDSKKVAPEVYRPCLSFIGESTPTDFEGVALDVFADGTTSRYIYALAYERPPTNDHGYQEFYAKDHIRNLAMATAEMCARNTPTGSMVEGYHKVAETPEAKKRRQEHADFIQKNSDTFEEAKLQVMSSCLNRYMENAIKIATIYAVCRNPQMPRVEVSDYDWAFSIMDASIVNIQTLLKSGNIGVVTDEVRIERVKEVLKRWLKAKGGPRQNPRKPYGKYQNYPYLFPFGYLQESLGARLFPSAHDIKRVVSLATDMGLIQPYVNPTAEEMAKNPDRISIRGQGYIITDPDRL